MDGVFTGTVPPHLNDTPYVAPTVSTDDVENAAFQGAILMTPGVTQDVQRSVGVNCTTAGNVKFLLQDGSSLILPVYPGWQTFPLACRQIVIVGTTAVATYFNLK